MTDTFKPKCIWCSAPWSDENVRIEDVWASQGCDTCGYGLKVSGTVTIECHACTKVMYQKEFSE